MIEQLLRYDPSFEAGESERPQLRAVIDEVRRQHGARPALACSDLGSACHDYSTVIVARVIEGPAIELWRFERGRLVADVVVEPRASDAEAVRALSDAAGQLPIRSLAGDAKAQAHFDAGKGLYRLGRYGEAMEEFRAGYQLARRPEFLINIGQSLRGLGDLARARAEFARFLDEAPPAHPQRAEIERLVSDLDRALVSKPVPSEPAAALAEATPPASPSAAPPRWPGAGHARHRVFQRLPERPADRHRSFRPAGRYRDRAWPRRHPRRQGRLRRSPAAHHPTSGNSFPRCIIGSARVTP